MIPAPCKTLLRSLCLLTLVASITACKVAEDAKAAAAQMTVTAADLSAYYTTLAQAIRNTIALEELQHALLDVPFDPQDRAQLDDTLHELQKRSEMAQSLSRLAASMSTLTKLTTSSDVSTAASNLGNELIKIKALPKGSPIPDAVSKASNILLQWLLQKKEKEAARTMDETLAALLALYTTEQPGYDSLSRTHIVLAAQLATELARREAVDPASLILPALKPLGLTPLPANATLRTTLKPLAVENIQAAAKDAIQQQQAASDSMLDGLKEMSARIHTLATEKPMPLRGAPFSLKIVESWVAAAI